MRLMHLTLLTPIRDETQVIYKWEERRILVSPTQIESVSWQDNIDKAVVMFTSGRSTPVVGTLEEIAAKYQEATT